MTEAERDVKSANARPRRWYVPDIICVTILFAYITYVHSSYLRWYIGGLKNRPPFFLDPFILFLGIATLPAIACLLLLAFRLALVWPEYIRDFRRLLKVCLSVILPLVAYAALHFVPLPPSVEDPFLLGYREYARPRMDVSGMQAWLAALDPNEWMERGGNGRLDYHVIAADRSAWPEIILTLRPDVVRPFLDDLGRPAVSLSWSRLHDSWGVEIGHSDMEIKWKSRQRRNTAPALGEARRYRLPLAPGAYVWHEVH